MNPGAFVYSANFLTPAEITEAAALASDRENARTAVHEIGKYSDLRWFQVPLDPTWPIAKKMLDKLDVSQAELLVFYYLEPGAVLHPHRDLTGASMNDRIRFHIPIVTNDNVEFVVNGEKIRMATGDLWCLDTSYTHSVRNDGDRTRVHLIAECAISPEVRKVLPCGVSAKLHNAHYTAILAVRFMKSVAINAVFDRANFRGQMGMIRRFIGWRFFGKGVS